MLTNEKFLGIGWKFPPQVNLESKIATSSYEKNIEESIHIILQTAKGERVMRPDFGCDINEFVFEIINFSTLSQIESTVFESLEIWEPRIDVIAVSAKTSSSDPSKLIISIEYLVRKTNNRFNLVYPFYISEGIESND